MSPGHSQPVFTRQTHPLCRERNKRDVCLALHPLEQTVVSELIDGAVQNDFGIYLACPVFEGVDVLCRNVFNRTWNSFVNNASKMSRSNRPLTLVHVHGTDCFRETL